MKTSLDLTAKSTNASTADHINYWKFIIPSFIGALLFLVPVKYDGAITIGVGIMASFVQSAVGDYLPGFIVLMLGVSAGLSAITLLLKPRFIMENRMLHTLFHVGPVGLAMRA